VSFSECPVPVSNEPSSAVAEWSVSGPFQTKTTESPV
jgi:hypothetical protein